MIDAYIRNWKQYLRTWPEVINMKASGGIKFLLLIMLTIALLFVVFGVGKDD